MDEPADTLDLPREAAAAPAVRKFSIYNKKYHLQGALDKLRSMKRSSGKQWWHHLEVCTTGDGDAAEPKLKCLRCDKLLTISNPTQSATNHLTQRACSGLKRAVAAEDAAARTAAAEATARSGGGSTAGGDSASQAAAAAGSSASAAGSSSSIGASTNSTTLQKRKWGLFAGMVATQQQQQSFEKNLARFFYKNAIPLQLTEDPDLKAAVAHVGLLPPSRRDMSNRLLDQAYNEVQAADQAKLAAQRLLQLSTDGWRRRTAVRGVPLINIMALMPPGGSVFVKVVAAPGVVKNKEWIKERHLEWASLITDGQLDRLLGMVMDNTKANM
jgi:hypothetical protein